MTTEMDMLPSRLGWRVALCLLVAALAGCGGRDDYPSRPVVLVCPWSAGGGTDRVARHMAAQLEGELGVPVNVVNATGGAGVTGHTRGALARPDGYTITLATAELSMLHWRGLTNLTHNDFDPLMLINRDDAALFVREDAAWSTLNELKEAIDSEPGTLKASGTAHGGIWHVSLAGWMTKAGMAPSDVLWISINGAAPSLQELISGGVDMVCCSLPEAQSLLDAKRVRCLGLMAPERLPAFPDVPTFAEQGVDWQMGTWRGLMAPREVPADRLDHLRTTIETVATGGDYREFMATAGFNPAAVGGDAFDGFLARVDEQLGAILTSEAFRSVQSSRFGPMVFPAILGLLLIVNVFILLARRQLRTSPDAAKVTRAGLLRVTMVAGWVAVYVLLAEPLGFLATATALLFALLWRFGSRWYVAAPLSVSVVALAYQLFAVYLRVPLPFGTWGT
ncbi:MAG: hypothetical protein GY851_05690 [bacterium]|nr:hypothetical protein [bacterium]